MSGAEPWIGSNRPGPAPSEADGNSPSEPASTAASSLRMSPNMFSVRITSNAAGSATRRIAAVSTYTCSNRTSGYSRATRVTVSRHSWDTSSTFALSTDVRRPRRRRAAANAMRATRSTSTVEYVSVFTARDAARPRGSP
jgi:hypothetical protein